jgi:hypothetical protein
VLELLPWPSEITLNMVVAAQISDLIHFLLMVMLSLYSCLKLYLNSRSL